jgi:hypothetical protein
MGRTKTKRFLSEFENPEAVIRPGNNSVLGN